MEMERCVCVCVCVRVCVRVYMASITATARPRRTAGRATPSRKAARRSLTVEHIASRCQLSGHSRGTSAVTALDATRNQVRSAHLLYPQISIQAIDRSCHHLQLTRFKRQMYVGCRCPSIRLSVVRSAVTSRREAAASNTTKCAQPTRVVNELQRSA